MQIRDYLSILGKRWWLILLVAVAATGASVVYSKLQVPTYRSTVKLMVTPSRYDYGLTMTIENLLRQYSQRLQTTRLAEKVNERLRLDLSDEKLLGKIKVSPISEDFLLMVTVDDTEVNRARDIAYVWADEFVKEQQILMAPANPTDRIDVAMLDRPTPAELYFPKTRQLAVAAGVLGLVVGLLFAFGLEYLDDTLKTAEDVERSTGLSVLGTIPPAGPSDFAPTGAQDGRGALTRAGQGG